MLTVVGGTYYEQCCSPDYLELRGSGLRGAAALSDFIPNIKLYSCIGKDDKELAEYHSNVFGLRPEFHLIDQTITFEYFHPLSQPIFSPEDINEEVILGEITGTCILYYGMLEARAAVNGSYVIYDPQNGKGFQSTCSKAEHLAIVLNLAEAKVLSGMTETAAIEAMAQSLLESENAEVVIIKNGAKGAVVVDKNGITSIPVFITASVWPIGSGDIFSAVFAWQWGVLHHAPADAALVASKMTAHYCESKNLLPLTESVPDYKPVIPGKDRKLIYLAGPFFSTAQIWLISEIRAILLNFGNDVFSPFHDVGTEGSAFVIATKDLVGLVDAHVLLAVVSGLDAGTLFEIGYAKALKKRVIILAENVSPDDLLMLEGTGCEITFDLTTAVYKASW